MNALPDMNGVKHIHFVGIGGAGMSGIAEVLLTQGFRVSGSDMSQNATTKHLEKLGAMILYGHDAANIKGADVIVYSSAIPKDNPELIAALQTNIPILARAQMLAELMRTRYGIAIGGTHGKTTTTSLTTTLLAEGGLDPTFVIGGLLRSAGTHARLGASKYFVAEADESDASFLYLQPQVVVVTNIDADHLNNYGNFANLKAAFLQFIEKLPANGLAIMCTDDPIVKEVLPKIKRPVLTYGFSNDDDVQAVDYQQDGTRCRIKVKRSQLPLLEVTLNLPGRHNVLNALAAIAVATHCGVSDEAIANGLNKFQGIGRRFQIHGEVNFGQGPALLIDDYGHHPREIAATLEAVRKAWPDRRLVLAFQPHRYTRTQAIFQDFVNVLGLPDALLLLEVYAAGEPPIPGINSQTLIEAITKTGKVIPVYVPKAADLPNVLRDVLKSGDILLTQGAGDIGKVALELVKLGFVKNIL